MNKQNCLFWTVLVLLCVGAGEVFGQENFTFSPTYGKAGDQITIYGSGFSKATTVYFGNKMSSSNYVSSSTQMFAFVPSGLTPNVPVVFTVGGVSSRTNFVPLGAGPYVSNFSPTNGDSSTLVTVNGANFTSSPKVYFNGVLGSNIKSTVYGQLTVNPPSSVVTGPITVTANNISYTTSNYFYGHPSITTVTPPSGRAGTTVKIGGKNLLGASSVLFNGQPAASFSVDSNTNISAILPDGITRGTIQVTTPDSLALSSDIFTVPPTVTDFSPKRGNTNTVVTITGVNLNVGSVSVSFNGGLANITSITATQILAVVQWTAKSGPVTVTTGDGSFTTPNFFYMPPEVTLINPGSAPVGTTVQITGNNLVDVTNVTFSGVSAVFTNSSGKINATVPAGAVTGPVSVSNPGGKFTTVSFFMVVPGLTGFSPDAGIVGSQVRITGSSISDATDVQFNGISAPFTTNGDVLTATVPTNATTGKITVVTKGGSCTSSSNFRVDPLKLSIAPFGKNGVTISWPTSAVNFVLQSVSDLNQANWAAATNAARVSTIFNTITNSGGSAQFYRLKK